NQAVQQLSLEDLKIAAAGKGIALQIGGETFELAGEDVVVERTPKAGLAVQAQGALVVALDLELNEDLIREGLARELVNNVQQMRKAHEFEVTDRIHLKLSSDEAVCAAVAAYTGYIQSEVLALSVQTVETEGETVDLNGHACTIAIEKA
ncbi:MAG: DUF5915 domain-containing protein, partial [Kiritimatiellales bacterium]